MSGRIALIGLDEPEHAALRARIEAPVLALETLPRVVVHDARLFVEASGGRMLAVAKVVYHGIFEDDPEFLAALALWGGPCFPGARGMMDLRRKLPGLVRALAVSRFGGPPRGYAAAGARFDHGPDRVAKWGDWHCGENKARFDGEWLGEPGCIVEPYFAGRAVRVVLIGRQAWQIALEGPDWLKSIHDPDADFMPLDPELADDAERIRVAFALEILANDYVVGDDGQKHLLEVNHVPNVTRFPAIWEAYRDEVVRWASGEVS